MKKSGIDRRKFFKKSSVVGVGLLATGAAVYAGDIVTPPQTEGPFFPVRDQADKDVDLTQVAGHRQKAKGEVVIVKGSVRDSAGAVLAGALIDVWQACFNGKYNHPRDPNPKTPDPDFQYWAKLKTDANGEYQFKTIIPGAYPATADWLRPPHIHFRVDAFRHQRLTTQMYFKGQELNDADKILIDTIQRFGKEAADSLVVAFAKEPDGDIPVGHFNITIGTTPAID
jgi:protocatechuate 3,4-dioxygenase beta subunit